MRVSVKRNKYDTPEKVHTEEKILNLMETENFVNGSVKNDSQWRTIKLIIIIHETERIMFACWISQCKYQIRLRRRNQNIMEIIFSKYK